MSKLRYFLVQLRAKLWVKPTITGVAAVAWVEAAYVASYSFSEKVPIQIDRDLLFNLLQILASTMLTVAIFAVTAMVGAFSSVATTATPRATRIVMQDRSAQNALAAFLSAFIYAIVSLVALSALSYGPLGRLLLFTGYSLIIVWVLVSFIRWVDQVSKLGRMNDTIRRVEEACSGAFTDSAISGNLGARPMSDEVPQGTQIFPDAVGYVQHIDMEDLHKTMEGLGAELRLLVRPGAFMDRHRPLAVVLGSIRLEANVAGVLSSAFTIGDERQIENDPRCGLLMLAEIADRALSPAVNDPGTAIAVMGAQLRLLNKWTDSKLEATECRYPSLQAPALDAVDLLEDAFNPIARDGAGIYEVGIRLQKVLLALQFLGDSELSSAASWHSRLALEQALQKLPTEYHKDKMRQFASLLEDPQARPGQESVYPFHERLRREQPQSICPLTTKNGPGPVG